MTKQPLARQSLYFVLITVLIDSIGFGLIIPVMPELLEELLGINNAGAAVWGGYLGFVYAAMHFLFGPLIGSLSDRFGRRPILLISMAALFVDYLILIFASTIAMLFIGRILTGICGATFATANAYIADVTTEKDRGKAFGLVGAAFGIGFILGPAIGGFLGVLDARAPFYAAAGISFLNMLYGYFVLPESLKKENRRSFSFARANPLGAFRQLRNFPRIKWLFVVCLILFFAHVVYPSTWQFHGKARYGWEASDIGLSLMAFGICSALVQGGLIGKILKRFGEKNTAFIGITCSVIAFAGFTTASQGWMLYCWIPLSALGAVATPAIKSIMSSRVPADSQGELHGTLASLKGIADMISPIMMTQVFAYFANESLEAVDFGQGLAGALTWTMFVEGVPASELDPGSHFYGSAFMLAGLLLCVAILPLIWGTWHLSDSEKGGGPKVEGGGTEADDSSANE